METKPPVIGREILYFPTLDSTMDTLREYALKKAGEGLVVVSFHQAHGRGRLGRAWQTPEGGLAVSVLLYPELKYLHELFMLGAVAVVLTAEVLGLSGAGIKWPNDVLIDGKKTAGVLIESRVVKQELIYAILGIGVNIDVDLKRLGSLPLPPGNISGVAGKNVSRETFLHQLLHTADVLYTRLKKGESVYPLWRRHMLMLGDQVEATGPEGIICATAEDVTPEGRLKLRLSTGEVRLVAAGDISLRSG
ncbi:MAG: biotin--[acetyl-CoA-carboxylase] ligase [Dehalococcoidaceae bacterium]|nr:biotin--[acetyl-CoA-carboxylase] ligase [Dehalococcoidaceae bacterium]